ncbi:MAG TPA: SIS domain-containing protein [Thermoplasmata archaeon]|nr:SIS domain-containing protein [Thermoplasmata archaeon]
MVELPLPQVPHPPAERTRHPYFTHDMIRRQAVAARATFRATVERLSSEPVAPPEGRLLFVGQGTSFHAALAARDAARTGAGASRGVEAVSSFDFVDSEGREEKSTTAVVFSASGDTALTLAAQQKLREAGARIVLITAAPGGASRSLADVVLESQYADEASWTHTASFTAGLVAAGALLDHWAGRSPLAGEEEAVGEAVNAALATENVMIDLVDAYAGRDRFLFLASGRAEPAARESALKMREAAGRFCATVGVEEFLHGVLPSVNERTVVLAISGTPLERERALQGLAAARMVGARTLLVDASGGPAEEGIVVVPGGARPMPPVLEVIPFQLLAYWTGTAEGRNPDVMGLDYPRYLAARSSFGI